MAEQGEWRYIKPNNVKDLWNKWGKKWMLEYYKEHNIKGKPQYRFFSKIAMSFLHLLLDRTIEHGEDIRIPYLGTIIARQVKHHSFRTSRYKRNFEFRGGREYTIHDLMRKFNRYPVVSFRNNGGTKFRTAYWRSYINLSSKLRHRLYQKFYDEGMEYKNLRYLTEEEWKKKKDRLIWRNGMLLKIKEKNV